MILEEEKTKTTPRKVARTLLKPLIPSLKEQWITTKLWSRKLTKEKIKLFRQALAQIFPVPLPIFPRWMF